MLADMLKAVFGVMLLMGVWIAVQAFLRKRLAKPRDFDVLEEMTHGCGACGHPHGCGGSKGACHP
jgi:hypothetical protein